MTKLETLYDSIKGVEKLGLTIKREEESEVWCTQHHFKTISDNGYIYDVVKDYKSLYDIVTK
jgi:type III restriction enzyme